jgi:catechol 2,3-dioxygenase-like lactoylglutathione lyase family enzyme
MIDHVSIAVRDLAASARFYAPVLAAIGYCKLVDRPDTVGFGKTYPEFWLNGRPAMAKPAADNGVHVHVLSTMPALGPVYPRLRLRWCSAPDGQVMPGGEINHRTPTRTGKDGRRPAPALFEADEASYARPPPSRCVLDNWMLSALNDPAAFARFVVP